MATMSLSFERQSIGCKTPIKYNKGRKCRAAINTKSVQGFGTLKRFLSFTETNFDTNVTSSEGGLQTAKLNRSAEKHCPWVAE